MVFKPFEMFILSSTDVVLRAGGHSYMHLRTKIIIVIIKL